MDLHVTPPPPPHDTARRPRPCSPLQAPWASLAERLQAATGQRIETAVQLHQFSVQHGSTFWRHFLGWAGLLGEGNTEPVRAGEHVGAAVTFPGLRLNYAENLLLGGGADPGARALTACLADGQRVQLTRAELRQQVEQTAEVLREHGVGVGDRVVAILRNDADAVVTALAVAAIGASLCSAAPGTSVAALVTRFAALEPRLMIAHMADVPNPIGDPLAVRVAQVAAALTSLNLLLTLDHPPLRLADGPPALALSTLLAAHRGANFHWQRFAYDQPLLMLPASGSACSQECIAHGAGALLLEHVRSHLLDGGLQAGDAFDLATSCGSLTWHWQLSALATGCELVLRDNAASSLQRVAAQGR